MLEIQSHQVIVGFALTLTLLIGFRFLQGYMPNPYGKQLYHIDPGQYTYWARKKYPLEAPMFRHGDMVHEIAKSPDDVHLVWVMEPNEGRNGQIPRAVLKPGSNLAAWWYKFQYGDDQSRKSAKQEPEGIVTDDDPED